jgi:hypothetical protein
MTADQVVQHLSKDDPVMWGRMTEVERAAYQHALHSEQAKPAFDEEKNR